MDTSVRSVEDSPGDRIAGLDGVRGLAVALVLGFHLYPRLVPGGWLGVSLFFTLSGFLITTVILRDLDNDTFSFRSFYARRIRRLLPAALLVLAVFSVSWALFGWFDTSHRTDVFFASLQIANWQQIWEGVPYGTALASPVVHYWSLAIEEQAYIVLPLLIVAVGARKLRLVAAALFIASVAATFLADANQSVIYFGTHTRAAEILAGVIAASLVHRTTKTPRTFVASVISVAGIAYLMSASVVVRLSDEIVYRGGLIVTGIISALVIVTIPHSPVAKIFSVTPLVWLGTVSYGIYLIHWPVLQTLKRTDLPQWTISPLTLGITLVLAAMMYRAFEQPLRFSFSGRQVVAAATAIMCVAGISFTFATRAPATFEVIADDYQQNTIPISDDKISIFLIGDSRALTFNVGTKALTTTSKGKGTIFQVVDHQVDLGCPIGRSGRYKVPEGTFQVRETCDWSDHPSPNSQIAIIWAGRWDAALRDPDSLEGDKFFDLASPVYRSWLANEYQSLFEKIYESKKVKLIAVVNHNEVSGQTFPSEYNAFLDELSKKVNFTLLDLAGYMSMVDQKSFLPDDVHLSFGTPTEYSPSADNSAIDLYEKWFEPILCKAIQDREPSMLNGKQCPEIDYSPRVKD